MIWHYYIASKSKNFLRENIFSGKLIWSSYICSILIEFLINFAFFGKLIWIYYSKPKLVPWGALFGQRCQLCETLMKRKVWGSFFGAQGAHFCDLGRKKLPQTLRFIRFERKWRPWTPRARKSSIWTTNSKPKLIFLKTRIFQKIALK